MSAAQLSILIALTLITIILALAILADEHSKKKIVSRDLDKNDWLFHNFPEKVYSLLWKDEIPEDIATKFGFDVEQYYVDCRICEETPNLKKIMGYFAIGIFLTLVSFALIIPVGLAAVCFGFIIFAMCTMMPKRKVSKRAEEYRIQVENELPRFLDILQTEIDVGIPMEQAIYLTASNIDGRLSEDFLKSLSEVELGLDGWQQALQRLSEKYEIDTLSDFVLDIITSFSKGVDISERVTAMTKEIRQSHLLTQKERAGKLQSSIVLPIMVLKVAPLMLFMLIPSIVAITSSVAN